MSINILHNKTIIGNKNIKVDEKISTITLNAILDVKQYELQDLLCDSNEKIDLDYINEEIKFNQDSINKASICLLKNKNNIKRNKHFIRTIKAAKLAIKKLKMIIKDIEKLFIQALLNNVKYEKAQKILANLTNFDKLVAYGVSLLKLVCKVNYREAYCVVRENVIEIVR